MEQLDIFSLMGNDTQKRHENHLLPQLLEVFHHFYPTIELAAVYVPYHENTGEGASFLVKVDQGFQFYEFYDWRHLFPRWQPMKEIPNDKWIVLNK